MKSASCWSCERRWCSRIKQRRWKMVRSTRDANYSNTSSSTCFRKEYWRNKKKLFMSFIFHFFEYAKLTDHSIFSQQKWSVVSFLSACRETHLNGIYVAAISHAVSLSLWQRLISNINISINFTMSFCKVYLGSRDIVRHIYYIKSQLLGLISLI